jgi:hypothetical protein
LSEFRSRVMHEINERETIKISADFNWYIIKNQIKYNKGYIWIIIH